MPQNLDQMPSMPSQTLRGFERFSVPLLEATNRLPLARLGLHFVSGWTFAHGFKLMNGRRWQVFGLEHMQALDAPEGMVLTANHRSFFDLFVVSTVLKFHTKLLRQLAFPVRSDFFYTHPLGVALNYTVAGASMWPPVFRDDRRRELNPVGMRQLARTLGRGCVIGIHPEGTRNKGENPYEYLPRKPGLGQLVLGCTPGVLIVPVYVGGLTNDVATEFKRTLQDNAREKQPVRIWFGQPFRADELQPLHDPAVMTETVFARIQELGEADRAWMAQR